ncbi:MAG: HAD family hydrolase [Anaerolineales bacterium]|nr:HAD family hydrolase [Anaerolineales bacterium]
MTEKRNYLIDMDGVLISGNTLIPGADIFLKRLRDTNQEYLVLTNNSIFTPRDLAHRLATLGLELDEDRIFTSALATARFLSHQNPGGKAFVIGESGLTDAIHARGFIITDTAPDYVVLGETNAYNFSMITKAVRLIIKGAKFVATNPDATGPTDEGIVPACGAMGALIEKASGKAPFFVGKPNPYMLRAALNYMGFHSEETVIVGDRMDTDIVAGVESGLETILVLSGVTDRDDVDRFPYRPGKIFNSVADIEIA